jgi:DNA damage-binding protein 2
VLAEQRWQVEAAVLKLLSRRCTCLEFHPTRDNIVLAGDKKGVIAIWDFEKV